MIWDQIENLSQYDFPGFDKVVEIIHSCDLKNMSTGSYNTDDRNVRYNVVQYETSSAPKKYEIHRKEADIQIVIEGAECIDYCSRQEASNAGSYDDEGDFSMLDASKEQTLHLSPGSFAIFFPGEPHKPGLSIPEAVNKNEYGHKVRKVIFKIRMEG